MINLPLTNSISLIGINLSLLKALKTLTLQVLKSLIFNTFIPYQINDMKKSLGIFKNLIKKLKKNLKIETMLKTLDKERKSKIKKLCKD